MVHGPSNLLEFYSQLWYDFYAMFGPLHSGTGDPSTEPYLSDTLAHVVTCPGSTPAQADQAKTINILREWFIGSEPQAPLENIDAADLPILMEPWAYVLQERDPKLLHAFLEKYQIPKESLALLGQLRDERDEHLLWPDSGYELLVNVFVLTQQGRANIFSPVQRALIEELYKKLPNGLENIRSTWDALDMAFPERSQ